MTVSRDIIENADHFRGRSISVKFIGGHITPIPEIHKRHRWCAYEFYNASLQKIVDAFETRGNSQISAARANRTQLNLGVVLGEHCFNDLETSHRFLIAIRRPDADVYRVKVSGSVLMIVFDQLIYTGTASVFWAIRFNIVD